MIPRGHYFALNDSMPTAPMELSIDESIPPWIDESIPPWIDESTPPWIHESMVGWRLLLLFNFPTTNVMLLFTDGVIPHTCSRLKTRRSTATV